MLVAATAALLVMTPAALAAQVNLGGQASWADDADLGLGARVAVGLPAVPLEAIGSFDYFFPDGDVDYWEINANVAYSFSLPASPVTPYAGGGLSYAHVSADLPTGGSASDSEVGLNVLGGVKFSLPRLQPFAEARVELGGGEQFVLTGGLMFNIGPGFAAAR
jgi:hypothetical protein